MNVQWFRSIEYEFCLIVEKIQISSCSFGQEKVTFSIWQPQKQISLTLHAGFFKSILIYKYLYFDKLIRCQELLSKPLGKKIVNKWKYIKA